MLDVLDTALECVGNAMMTSITSAQKLKDIPKGATHALVQAHDENVRYWPNAQTPTATQGHAILATSQGVFLPVVPLNSVRVIEEVSGASLSITYYRPKVR